MMALMRAWPLSSVKSQLGWSFGISTNSLHTTAGPPITRRFADFQGLQHPKLHSSRCSASRLYAANRAGLSDLDEELARWLAKMPTVMADKLAAVGLIPKRESEDGDKQELTLQGMVDRYIASRTDVKPDTATVWKRTRNHLVAFFGEEREFKMVTIGDAKDFRLHLLRKKLADNTVRRTCGIAKQFFEDAIDRDLITKNPFKHRDIPTSTSGNSERQFLITRDMTEALIEVCPNAEWRLIVALSRYAGLRCPSEHLRLRWGDIDWDRGRMNVTSPKTEHHEGKGSRTVPIFPELRPHLEAMFDAAPDGAEYVLPSYRDRGKNFRTRLERIIKRAGLKPWPKLFHNLRASCQTELEDSFPSHVVCAWLGNSEAVARKHYLQVTDDHFEKAITPRAAYALQIGAEPGGIGQYGRNKKPDKPLVLQGLPGYKVGDEGLEPPTSTV
jgi:integrase